MSSTLFKTYLGSGAFADRPAAPDIAAEVLAFYWADDTLALYTYDKTNGWLTVGGGGGGGGSDLYAPMILSGSASSQADASMGSVWHADKALVLNGGLATFDAVSTGVYKLGVAPFLPGGAAITAAPTYTPTFTATASVTTTKKFKFDVAFDVNAGDILALWLQRDDAGGSNPVGAYAMNGPLAVEGFNCTYAQQSVRCSDLPPTTSSFWNMSAPGWSVVPWLKGA